MRAAARVSRSHAIGAHGIEGLPGALFGVYQKELNDRTDLAFWMRTNYKSHQLLDPNDPADRAMIPQWWAIRTEIERSRSPRDLIRERAVRKVFALYQSDRSRPVFVYSAIGPNVRTSAWPALGTPDVIAYVGARMHDSNYVAIFNAASPKWPQPIFDAYPQEGEGIEIEKPSPNVSGERGRGHYKVGSAAESVIYHEGHVLRPLTTDVVMRMPDLDPAQRDAAAASSPGWLDFSGRRQPAKLIRDVWQPGDMLYYWDGPWGMLSGSRGIALVWRGRVVETFTTIVS